MSPPSYDTKKERLKDILLGLHWAATTGNVGLVKFALDHGVPIDSVVNGFVPLQLACINDNNIAVVQYLIDRGADVNIQKWSKKHSVDKSQAVQGATGSTALHVACANGCVKIVSLLLRNGARVDVKDKYGSTPLDIALAKNETDIIKLLKAAREKQRRRKSHTHSNSLYDEEENETRKSLDKQTRMRRPSLPSILEHHHQPFLHNIHSVISMTPSEPFSMPVRSSLVHRPSAEDNHHTHSCPTTPSSSVDNHSMSSKSRIVSPHHSEDEAPTRLSSSSPRTPSKEPDWYGYGVINSYEDDNYLLSLERRAYNLPSNAQGGLERNSHELKRDMTHKRCVSTGSTCTAASKGTLFDEPSDEGGYEGEYDDDGSSSESPRASIALDSETDLFEHQGAKKKWLPQSVENMTRRSLDLRPNLAQLAKRGVPHKSNDDEDTSEEEQQRRNGFFSKWVPTWSRNKNPPV